MTAHPDETPQGEWLFQQEGMLYGPVPARLLLEQIEAGAIGAATPVARDGEPFRPIGEEPAFAVHVARAEARRRVEAQARADEARRRRRRIAWIGSVAAGAILLALGAVRLVLWAEGAGLFAPDPETLSALQIEATLPTIRLQPLAERQEEELLEYLEPEEAATPKRASRRKAPAAAGKRAEAASAAAPREAPVTEVRYDQGAIQAVLAREQKGLYPCLQEQVRRDPAFRGEVPLSFTIDNDGSVGRVWIDRAGVHEGPLYDCFRERMGSWRFPAFAGERPSVSLSFNVGS